MPARNAKTQKFRFRSKLALAGGPARSTKTRDRRSKDHTKPNSRRRFKFLGIVIFLIVLAWFGIKKIFPPFTFNTFSVATINSDASASIMLFDFENDLIKTFIIPQKTEISMARQRGLWKMESVWKLIESEKLNPKTYSDSLMRTFGLPIDHWAKEDVMQLSDSDLLKSALSIGKFGSSNISFRDRVRLFWFARGVRSKDRETVALSDTTYLKKTTLSDGESGYVVSGNPQDISGAFSESTFISPLFKIQVVNPDGTRDETTKIVVSIVETLGANVLAIKKNDTDLRDGNDCNIIVNKISVASEKLAAVFSCSIVSGSDTNFDAVIELGEAFYARF